jgi:cytochrome c-type biogenesis protein CcmE
MKHRSIKIAVTAVVLTLAFSGLLWSTLQEGAEYFKHVDEVMVAPEQWEGKRINLHGFVVSDSILVNTNAQAPIYKFKVQHNGRVVDATYTGVVPDTFKDTPGMEAEVVLKGRLTPDGFHTDPNGITAKCPSKYEEQKKVG